MPLDPDRLLPTDTTRRAIARRLYAEAAALPIVSAHSHVEAALLVDDRPFADPASLLVVPDHYVTRMLHAHGVDLADLYPASRAEGLPERDARRIWRIFCEHWPAFRGTPSRYWIESILAGVFEVDLAPAPATADELFDRLVARFAEPALRPRALFERFGVETLATTDDPCSDLADHRRWADHPSAPGRLIPTFRPDACLDPTQPGWAKATEALGAAADVDTGTYEGFLEALRRRRDHFRAMGATATDHGTPDARTCALDKLEAQRLFTLARAGGADAGECEALRRHLLLVSAGMSCDDGLVMQLHAGVLRNHHRPTSERFGPDTGHDIPVQAEFTRSLRPLLERYGTHPSFRLVLYTVDETAWSRELAPLAGFYPSVFVGAPWWYLDTPDALLRFRRAVTDTAGFAKTAGFVDDTRAFCSLGVRHDTARRVDCSFLADLVATSRLGEDEAAVVARDLAYGLPRRVFNL